MRSEILERNRVRVLGNGSTTVVLSHGWGTDQTVWASQVEALASLPASPRIVLFDHVGCGGSDLSAFSRLRYSTFQAHADDLLEVLGEVGVEGALFVGHSMACMVGLLAARAEPGRFSSMVWLGASPRYLNAPSYRGGFEQADLDALFTAMARNYQGWALGFGPVAMGNPERPELGEYFGRALAAMRPDIALATAKVIFGSDHRDLLAGHAVPTVVVQPRNDVAVPMEVGEYLAAHLPEARLVRIDAEGHLPHVSAPGAVNAILREIVVAGWKGGGGPAIP